VAHMSSSTGVGGGRATGSGSPATDALLASWTRLVLAGSSGPFPPEAARQVPAALSFCRATARKQTSAWGNGRCLLPSSDKLRAGHRLFRLVAAPPQWLTARLLHTSRGDRLRPPTAGGMVLGT